MDSRRTQIILHHIGCLTQDINKSIADYSGFCPGAASQIYHISHQGVKVCFLEQAPGVFIEFVEPLPNNATMFKLLEQKKHFYHLGYLCKEFDTALEQMKGQGYHLISQFASEAFNNKRCAFLLSGERHLIELIEN